MAGLLSPRFRFTSVLAACLGVGVLAQPQAGGRELDASITLKPALGPPTTRVKVNGTGLGATEQVLITFDAHKVGSATTDGTGSTGALLCSYATPVWPSPAVAGGVVYAGSDKLYALDASSGALKWTSDTGTIVYSSPAVANGVVYVGSGNIVYALDASTGAAKWSQEAGRYDYDWIGSPAVTNGMLYVGSTGHGVYAFGLP